MDSFFRSYDNFYCTKNPPSESNILIHSVIASHALLTYPLEIGSLVQFSHPVEDDKK